MFVIDFATQLPCKMYSIRKPCTNRECVQCSCVVNIVVGVGEREREYDLERERERDGVGLMHPSTNCCVVGTEIEEESDLTSVPVPFMHK